MQPLFLHTFLKITMATKYNEYDKLNLPDVAEQILKFWEEDDTFAKSISTREGSKPYVFYEGPPSANGQPGIHHVLARAIKDIFCRYHTLKGEKVLRKAGWDTHGLPIELSVEKELGITKEDIGKKISVEEYNEACRTAVMRYTDVWNDLTVKMGYWVDMENPYVTYEPKYMETVWWLLQKLYKKGLIYKGYTIQPYSPKAGTGLSSHELNQPGTYRDVKDTTVVAQFRAPELDEKLGGQAHFVAWTTTPWTLPSNTALAVGEKIDYVAVKTFNQYTSQPIIVIMAKALVGKWFKAENAELSLDDYQEGDKKIPYQIVEEFKGSELVGVKFDQLLPYAQPDGKGFEVIGGDFVSTEDGTGIVHIAPTFGADDARVAKVAGMGAMLVDDGNGNMVPLVNLQGKFRSEVSDFAGEYVKAEYYTDEEIEAEKTKQGRDKYLSVDERIAIKLKTENKAFRVERYEHSYPHCWRTDKPILYYPLDSWFIRTTESKDRLIELNNTINWKPASTGTGRFGNWLENLQDWNLSRSRYWGIPLPIWRTEDGDEAKCIGSVEELKAECAKAVEAGVMSENPLEGFTAGDMSEENYSQIDLHKSHMDKVVLVSDSGKPMARETDLIDVWFDSGSMPYAQLHYPFENKELIDDRSYYPADFIAEGVDQTRGWFFTLHAIATMCFDSVAYKNVVSNGLVLDKAGQKMSKRLGNAADSFETLSKYGPDATRWYMITNAEPWDNLKFDADGILESTRKFFGTLYNTYGFFAMYANIDKFDNSTPVVPVADRPEIDRWVMSRLNSLIAEADQLYAEYEPKKAGRVIQEFVTEHLSNWYVRLCRRRFWKGELSTDKYAAYQTLYTCLETVAQLMSPIAPFYSDKLFMDLNQVTGMNEGSVHLSHFPKSDSSLIDADLEQRMEIAQTATSLILSIRKKEKIRVRQPLQKIMIPVLDGTFQRQLEAVEGLILSEVNVKELQYLEAGSDKIKKQIKANFKALGPKYGKIMKAVAAAISQLDQASISEFETNGTLSIDVDGQSVELSAGDAEITSEDIPGWTVASEGSITVALDVTLTESLKEEGIARELVNRIQNLRKDSGFEVIDRINLAIQKHEKINAAVNNNLDYICDETLANSLDLVEEIGQNEAKQIDVVDDIVTFIKINRIN
ncbi:MAG: isoleucyl-tRNA synthetase [Bacteroidia bacterium]